MQEHYKNMLAAKQHVIQKLKELRELMLRGHHVSAHLTTHRENMVHNLNLFNQASLEAIRGLDATLASKTPEEAIKGVEAAITHEGIALHNLIGMMQGRAPQPQAAPSQGATAVAPAPQPEVQTQPPSVEASNGAVIGEAGAAKAGMQSQVAEIIDPATGTKTVFENGVPVSVTQVQ